MFLCYRGPKHFTINENKCSYFPVFPYLFESFRRDLNEAKAVYIAECYLVYHFCNCDALITSQVFINAINH